MTELKTLYKIAKNGKTQTWRMELKGDSFRTISGYEDGEKVLSNWTKAQAKNLGRSNATSPEQQAKLEVEAEYIKKLAQGGYSLSIKEAEGGAKFIKPMLAKGYTDYPPSAEEIKNKEIFSQPKLDGVRCIATSKGLWSRQGKPITSCPHVTEALKGLFEKNPSLVLDGELYADKYSDNFNAIISIVRREKCDEADLTVAKDFIKYHVYDIVDETKTFSERTKLVASLLKGIKYCQIVDTTLIKSQDHIDELFADYVGDGYEGQMIRRDTEYENSRSKSLLKRKEFDDAEFKILDIIEGVGNRSGMAGKILYQIDKTTTCESGIAGGVELYKELLKNKKSYIGGTGTVKYFGKTPEGKLRFPVTVAVFKGKRNL